MLKSLFKIVSFLILLIVGSTSAFGQNPVIKGTGILYWANIPTVDATLPSGSEWGYVLANKSLYYFDRDSSNWLQYRSPSRVFEIANVSDTSSVRDFKEGSMFVTPSGALGIRAKTRWKVLQSSASNSLYVGSGNVPPGTVANVLTDLTFSGSGAVLQLVSGVLNLQGTSVNIVGPTYVGDIAAPSGDSVLVGANSLGRLIEIPFSYFPSFSYVDSLANTISGLDTAYSVNDTLYLITPQDTFEVALPVISPVNANRAILRVPTVGVNMGVTITTPTDWIHWWYFAPPTMTLALSPTTTVYEVGTTNSITISGTTTNSGGSTLSSGTIDRTSPSATSINSFGSSTTYTTSISFQPRKDSTAHYKQLAYSFRATQAWSGSGESGTATSSTVSISGVYPVLYGMSATDFSVTGDPYTLTKLVQAEGNKTVTLNGSGYIYYAIPTVWGDNVLSSIIDHNGFNVTPSFTATLVNVISSGLAGNWTQQYRLYKLNSLTTTSNFNYIFNR